MAKEVKIVSFVSSFSPSDFASIPSPAFAGGQCAPHNVFIFKRHVKKQQPIYSLPLLVSVQVSPPLLLLADTADKKPLVKETSPHPLCLPSLPPRLFCLLLLISPLLVALFFPLFCTISLRQMKRGWVEKAWVGEACKSKKGKEVSNNGKKGCTAAKIEKEPSRGRKGWESSSLRGGGWKREDMTGLFPESCKQLFICYKSRPGGGGRQINTTFKILLQEIYFFPPMQWWLSLPCCQTHQSTISPHILTNLRFIQVLRILPPSLAQGTPWYEGPTLFHIFRQKYL